jgi:hypothetical protein
VSPGCAAAIADLRLEIEVTRVVAAPAGTARVRQAKATAVRRDM